MLIEMFVAMQGRLQLTVSADRDGRHVLKTPSVLEAIAEDGFHRERERAETTRPGFGMRVFQICSQTCLDSHALLLPPGWV